MSLYLIDDKSTLVQVMTWCRQATSHYLSQWWPRSLSTYGIARPQWGQNKIATIFQMTFSNAFSWMKMHQFWLRFQWSLFLGVQLTIFQHWFRKWLGAAQATSHCLNQWCLIYWRIYASLGLNELKGKIHRWKFAYYVYGFDVISYIRSW